MSDNEDQNNPQVVSDNEECALDNLPRLQGGLEGADADDAPLPGLSLSSKRAFPT
jgi:hypothetical protein